MIRICILLYCVAHAKHVIRMNGLVSLLLDCWDSKGTVVSSRVETHKVCCRFWDFFCYVLTLFCGNAYENVRCTRTPYSVYDVACALR